MTRSNGEVRRNVPFQFDINPDEAESWSNYKRYLDLADQFLANDNESGERDDHLEAA